MCTKQPEITDNTVDRILCAQQWCTGCAFEWLCSTAKVHRLFFCTKVPILCTKVLLYKGSHCSFVQRLFFCTKVHRLFSKVHRLFFCMVVRTVHRAKIPPSESGCIEAFWRLFRRGIKGFPCAFPQYPRHLLNFPILHSIRLNLPNMNCTSKHYWKLFSFLHVKQY